MKFLLAMGVLFLYLAAQAQSENHLLVCAGPLHADLVSLTVTADMKSASDTASLNIQFQDGSFQTLQATKEDFVEGYIVLPAFAGVERALVLDDNGWVIALTENNQTEFVPTNCFEPEVK